MYAAPELDWIVSVWKPNLMLSYLLGRTRKNLDVSAKFWFTVEEGASFEATSPVLGCLLWGQKDWQFL